MRSRNSRSRVVFEEVLCMVIENFAFIRARSKESRVAGKICSDCISVIDVVRRSVHINNKVNSQDGLNKCYGCIQILGMRPTQTLRELSVYAAMIKMPDSWHQRICGVLSLIAYVSLSIVIFYFIFEMQAIKAKIQSNDTQEYIQTRSKHKLHSNSKNYIYLFRLISRSVMCVSAIYALIFVGLRFMKQGGVPDILQAYKDNQGIFDSILLADFILKFLIDCYMFALFISILRFFVSIKLSRKEVLSNFNKAIVALVVTLAILNLVQGLTSLVNGIILTMSSSTYQSMEYSYYRRLTFEVFFPFLDGIEALSLTYLFYFQGMRAKAQYEAVLKQKVGTEDLHGIQTQGTMSKPYVNSSLNDDDKEQMLVEEQETAKHASEEFSNRFAQVGKNPIHSAVETQGDIYNATSSDDEEQT